MLHVFMSLSKSGVSSLFPTAQTASILQTERSPLPKYYITGKLCNPINLVGIVFEAYAALGSPGRRSQLSDDPVVMEDPIIKEIAEKHGATPGQVKLPSFCPNLPFFFRFVSPSCFISE